MERRRFDLGRSARTLGSLASSLARRLQRLDTVALGLRVCVPCSVTAGRERLEKPPLKKARTVGPPRDESTWRRRRLANRLQKGDVRLSRAAKGECPEAGSNC